MKRGFAAFVWLLAAGFTAATVWLAERSSHFFRDDFAGFFLARHASLWTAVTTPIDLHFVPLHRLVDQIVYAAAPLDFHVALAVLAGAHIAGVVGLAATLRRLKPSAWNLALVSVYATNVYLGVLFLWWTSGLHRLPYIALAILTLYHWLGYRRGDRPRSLLWAAACLAGAFGFYSKAPLIPLSLLAVELALWPETPRALRRRNLATAGCLLAAAAAVAFLARFLVDSRFSGIQLAPDFLWAFELRSFAILAEGLLGFVGDGGGAPWAVAVLLGVVVATTLLRPWNAVVWAAGAALLAIQIGAIGVSHRAAAFGLEAAGSYRYYYELVYLVVLFAALALHGVALPPALDRRRWRRVGAAVGGAALLLLAGVSFGSFRELLATPRYRQYAAARVFVTNLKAGVAALQSLPRAEVAVVDSLAPDELTGKSVAHIRRYSDFLTIFGWEGASDPDAPRLYQVTDQGVVRRIGRPE